MPHSTYLGVEAVGFAEVELAAFFVAKEAGEVSGFFAEEGGQHLVLFEGSHFQMGRFTPLPNVGSGLGASRISESKSSGTGKRMVEFCSFEISVRVCR